MTVRLLALVLALGLLPGIALSERESAGYVAHALELIERHALTSEAVDWSSHRARVLARAGEAVSSADAYALIDETLALLGDRHSHLRRPRAPGAGVASGLVGGYAGARPDAGSLTVLAVHPDSPAAAAGLRRGDRIVRVDGEPVTPGNARALHAAASRVGARLLVRSPDGATRTVTTSPRAFAGRLPPAAYRFGERVAVLELPAHSGDGLLPGVGGYAALAHEALAGHADACGWVVDLRLNTGGNMWPMLAAAAPLLGEGELGAFVLKGGERWLWTFAGGTLRADGVAMAAAPDAPALLPSPPVAVLTSGLTASAAEALAVAFRGRPGARSFGEATAGVPAVNRTFPLPDGATLFLTVGRFADRTGRVYEEPLPPDVELPVAWEAFGAPGDPLLVAASGWLLDQPGCR